MLFFLLLFGLRTGRREIKHRRIRIRQWYEDSGLHDITRLRRERSEEALLAVLLTAGVLIYALVLYASLMD